MEPRTVRARSSPVLHPPQRSMGRVLRASRSSRFPPVRGYPHTDNKSLEMVAPSRTTRGTRRCCSGPAPAPWRAAGRPAGHRAPCSTFPLRGRLHGPLTCGVRFSTRSTRATHRSPTGTCPWDPSTRPLTLRHTSAITVAAMSSLPLCERAVLTEPRSDLAVDQIGDLHRARTSDSWLRVHVADPRRAISTSTFASLRCPSPSARGTSFYCGGRSFPTWGLRVNRACIACLYFCRRDRTNHTCRYKVRHSSCEGSCHPGRIQGLDPRPCSTRLLVVSARFLCSGRAF